MKIYPTPQALCISMKNPRSKHLDIQLIKAAGGKIYTIDRDLAGSHELYLLNVKSYPAGFYQINLRRDMFTMVKT